MTADAHPRDHDRPPVTDRRWIALIVIAVAQLMTALDATVVNIALPSAPRSSSSPSGRHARQPVPTCDPWRYPS
jgi:hypothetical protein